MPREHSICLSAAGTLEASKLDSMFESQIIPDGGGGGLGGGGGGVGGEGRAGCGGWGMHARDHVELGEPRQAPGLDMSEAR